MKAYVGVCVSDGYDIETCVSPTRRGAADELIRSHYGEEMMDYLGAGGGRKPLRLVLGEWLETDCDVFTSSHDFLIVEIEPKEV